MTFPNITAGRQDTSRQGRRRVSSAARRVGTRLISQPLTDRGHHHIDDCWRSAGVITTPTRPRLAQATHHKQIGS